SPTIVRTVLPAPVMFKQIEERLRTSLKDWNARLIKLHTELEQQLLRQEPEERLKELVVEDLIWYLRDELGPLKSKVVPGPWFAEIDTIADELDQTKEDLRTIREDLETAKVEADYGSILVGSWPANHYL